MITVENILNSCDALRKERKGEVKILMTKWLDSFIEKHRPWRAIVGSKKGVQFPFIVLLKHLISHLHLILFTYSGLICQKATLLK